MRVFRTTLALVFVYGLPDVAQAGEKQSSPSGVQHALLVGCTKYGALPERDHLIGPGNDVLLLDTVLRNKYHFDPKNITILSEAEGQKDESRFPTRRNIEREFKRLGKAARERDRVVILLSGHGSRQPDAKPDDENRFKPDGLEEIFLPADVARAGSDGKLAKAIQDWEFRDWLADIRKQKASVWVIVDCCHSASMIRGSDDEVARDVPPEDLGLQEANRAAEDNARTRNAGNLKPGRDRDFAFKLPPDDPDLVAIYACQYTEKTYERLLPPDGSNPVQHGLLTFALCQALLESAEPLTYLDLVERIHAKYRSWGRNYPTPLIEGKDRNLEVLGDKEHRERVRFPLRGNRQNGWSVDAGLIHGLTANSILAVYPLKEKPKRNSPALPIGYVRVLAKDLQMLRAGVEPIAHAQLPAVQEFPEDARCELVSVAFGDFRLKLAVDPLTQANEPLTNDEREALTRQIKKLESNESLVQVLDGPAEAHWLLRMDARESKRLYLVPASGLPTYVASTEAKGNERPASLLSLKNLPSTFGPVPAGDKMVPWLSDSLGRIARAKNLLRVIETSKDTSARGELGVKVALELVLLKDKNDKAGEPIIPGAQGIKLHSGDLVGFRVKNEGRVDADVNLLYLEAGFGIQPVFPKSVSVDNRLRPGKALLFRARVNSDSPLNVEDVVLIAVGASAEIAPYANFAFLAQPRLAQARSGLGETTSRGFESPLGRLLRSATYGDRSGGSSLAFEAGDDEQFACKIISWQVDPRPRAGAP